MPISEQTNTRNPDSLYQQAYLQKYNEMLFCTYLGTLPDSEVLMNLECSPAILKTRDLAILLDLSPDTVNDMARRGILKGYKSGNQWRFRRKDVERYFEKEGLPSPSV